MGLFERLGRLTSGGRRRAAAARERSGELDAAVELYVDAGLPDEAARVLLLRADGERDPERRIALCEAAARTALTAELRTRALRRKGRVALDVLRDRGGAALPSELGAVGRDLEEAGDHELAAEAYALAGDTEGEVRALTAAGAIERLEERLRETSASARGRRDLDRTLREFADLDRTAERRRAVEVARSFLETRPDDAVAAALDAVLSRIERGPVVEIELDGARARHVLGAEVTLGREGAIAIASRAVSRVHLAIRRGASGAVIEDLGGRNGTLLAGASVTGELPVGAGLRLDLGGQVPCVITPVGRGVRVEVAGGIYEAPLGELPVGPWRLDREGEGDEAYVVLRSPPGAPRPVLGDYELASVVELCRGDALRGERGGPIRLRVGGTSARRGQGGRSGERAR